MATLEQEARAFARKYPTPRSHPNGGDSDWDQDCGAAMSRFCVAYGTGPSGDVHSAWTVWKRTATAGTDPSKAPAGAFHFWDIAGPENGHVGIDIFGGGGTVFMANASVTDIEGAVNLGFNSVAGYGRARPAARYVGWTNTYAGGTVSFDAGSGTAGGGAVAIANFSADTQAKLQQYVAAVGLYSGPVDGALGVNSWKAIQQWLANVGLYGGPVDGEPGENTYKGLQSVAKQGGYTGPIDGAFGPNGEAALNAWLTSQVAPKPPAPPGVDWAAWQRFLAAYGYGGPSDGQPGPNTYTALQTFLAQSFGYTGPIDGEPGDFTWAAFAKAVAAGYPTPATTPPVVTPPVVTPPVGVPVAPAGKVFVADIASPQKGFDAATFKAAGGKGVIVKMGGANASDSPYVAPNYATQLAGVRAQGLSLGHYWFNGARNGLTPVSSADFFGKHAEMTEGDIVALDVEAEPDTGTVAYTPAQAKEFIDRFRTYYPGAKFLIYLNVSLLRGADWSPLVADGHELWLADPSSIGFTGAWSRASIVQYATGPVPGSPSITDQNFADADLWQRLGWRRPTPPIPDPPVVVTDRLPEFLEALEALVAEFAK